MKILFLGGGNCQFNGIKRVKEKGHEVVVADYYEDAPGKSLCDYPELVSTFDVESNILLGRKHGINGVITMGTDQPVYTGAVVAETLDIPFSIDVNIAKAVTNKRLMKDVFSKNNIPTVNFVYITKDFKDEDLDGISFPVVVKPLDSQGQRGVFKLNDISEIREKIDEVLSYSRVDEILVEEFYKNDEITVSGWVVDTQTKVLTVTDRVTHDKYPNIGICIAHDFPSKHLHANYDQIIDITEDIVKAFKIKKGPIYFQMLVGDDGIKVNEIACRLGGAYEDVIVPILTGVDVLDLLIDETLGKKIENDNLLEYNLKSNKKCSSVQLFFAKPGKVVELSDIENIKNLIGVHDAGFNFSLGEIIPEMKNATARAGYVIVEGKNHKDLKNNIDNVYKHLYMKNEKGENLVLDLRGISYV